MNVYMYIYLPSFIYVWKCVLFCTNECNIDTNGRSLPYAAVIRTVTWLSHTRFRGMGRELTPRLQHTHAMQRQCTQTELLFVQSTYI